MKKNNIFYCLLISIIVFSSGCIKSSNLDLYSQTDFYGNTPFETVARLENQVRGFYSGLRVGNLYGSRILIYNDVRGENFLSNDPNRVTARAAWEFSEADTDNEVNNLWAACYTVINRVNLFIDGMTPEVAALAGNRADQFIAEARFTRALAYYSLLQFYARPYPDGNGNNPGVPLRLIGIQEYGFNDLARSTVAQVYTQILEDLNFAENNLPLTYGASAEQTTTRAHRNTAIALKTRVYLSMANYPAVVNEANKIVSVGSPFVAESGVNHALQDNIATVFTNYVTTESILSLPFTSNEQPGGQSQLGFYYMPNIPAPNSTGAAGIFYINPAGIWGNTDWSADDDRRALTTSFGGRTWLAKWRSPGPFLDWSPIMRYSEVLLSLAEALARTTQSVDSRALELLNAVRERSDPNTTFSAGDFADYNELVETILTERDIEFLGEGIRSIDILRLVRPFPAKAIPNGASVSAIAPSNQAYIWPLPSEEVRYNKSIND